MGDFHIPNVAEMPCESCPKFNGRDLWLILRHIDEGSPPFRLNTAIPDHTRIFITPQQNLLGCKMNIGEGGSNPSEEGDHVWMFDIFIDILHYFCNVANDGQVIPIFCKG